MTAITKLFLNGEVSPEALYRLQDATNNLFNSLLDGKPKTYDSKVQKDLTDSFVIKMFKYPEERKNNIKKECERFACKLYKLGYKKINLSSIERAASRARKASTK